MTLADAIQIVTYYASVLLFVAVAGALLLLRPGRMTWAFFAIAAGLAVNPISVLHYPSALMFPALIAIELSGTMGNVALMVFAARFPNDSTSGWVALCDRMAVPFYFILALTSIYYRYPAVEQGHEIAVFIIVLSFVPLVIATAIVVQKFLALPRGDRQRLAWVTASFALYIATFFPMPAITNNPTALQIANNIAQALVPLVVAYATVKHRVIDIRFAISLALVYTVLSGGVVGIFAILDWSIGTALAQTRLALIVSIGV